MAALVGLQNRIGTETNGEKFEAARLIAAGFPVFSPLCFQGVCSILKLYLSVHLQADTAPKKRPGPGCCQ